MTKAARKQPWWLESGHELCSACGHTYVYETGFFCEACDGSLCWVCVEDTISGTVLCLECNGSEKSGSAKSIAASSSLKS